VVAEALVEAGTMGATFAAALAAEFCREMTVTAVATTITHTAKVTIARCPRLAATQRCNAFFFITLLWLFWSV